MIKSLRPGGRVGFTVAELLVVIVLLALLAGVVWGVFGLGSWIGKSVSPSAGNASASYSPPVLPLAISINGDGEVTVKLSGSLVTPLGTFSAEWEQKEIKYLELTLGNETRFYPLGKEKFRVQLPNSLDNGSHIRYDGDGNVRVMVPSPGRLRFSS